jgi:tetratricopeptide (TPR) repeat protein
LGIAAALGQEDVGAAVRDFEKATHLARPGNWMADSEKRPLLQAIGTLYYRTKNYKAAVASFDSYAAAGGNDKSIATLRLQSLFRTGDCELAGAALDIDVSQSLAANERPSNESLEMLARCRERLKDDLGYGRAIEMLVKHYPKKQYWQALLSRLWNRPDLSPWLRVEVGRLNLQTGTLADAADHAEFADLSIKAGYPIDAVRALEQAVAKGLVNKEPESTKHQAFLKRATQLLEQDRANSQGDARNALQSNDVNGLAAVGFNLALMGQGEQGERLMLQALETGGARRPDVLRLHLGIARVMAGRGDQARQVLAGVSGAGGVEELARYWALLSAAP